MRVTYNWLKDFVDIKISVQDLAEKLTMAGLEVTSLEKKEGDFVFEIEITSNRPDWLSVIGIAREVAAITGEKLKLSPRHKVTTSQIKKICRGKGSLQIKIEDKKDCPLYTAKIITGVTVGSSPLWLKNRLELVGCRSINNIVDITNYVLYEWGEPLHAFDLDKLEGGAILVRRAKEGERLVIIDGSEKILNPEILVIADIKKPVAVAGIMGGKDTEVNAGTKNILLEAAVFSPLVTRRARRALGLQTESSYRFERSVDLEVVDKASWRAVALIQELGPGVCVLASKAGAAVAKKTSLSLDTDWPAKFLGANITTAKIKSILSSLGFRLTCLGKSKIKVGVPSHRQDVTKPIDLVEEIARIAGYENTPVSLPTIKPQISAATKRDFVAAVKNILVGLGVYEVITHSLISRDIFKAFGMDDAEAVEIANPLSQDQEILRPTLMPSLLKVVAHNLNQKQEAICIFEIAAGFRHRQGAAAQEELRLGLVLCGEKSRLSTHGVFKETLGPLHLKGIVETLLIRLGIKENAIMSSITSIDSSILEAFDIKNKEVVALEISLDKLFSRAQLKKCFTPLPLYPGISRDISFVVKEEVLVEEIIKAIRKQNIDFLCEIKIADYYKGKQVPAGFKGLTISFLYRSDTRTLTEEEVTPLHASLCAIVTEKFGAKIR